MHKRHLILLTFLLLVGGWRAQAQQSISASSTACATSNSCMVVQLSQSNSATVAFTVSGTWSATLQFEVSQDGTNFIAVNAFPPNSTTAATSATANGTWKADVAGMKVFRVRCSAYTSGSAVVNINASQAISSAILSGGGGGGGGSGTVTSVGLTVPSWLTNDTPTITTSGTFGVTPTAAQTSHQVIGTCGSATTFTPCALVAGDIPAISLTAGVSGILPPANGGTGVNNTATHTLGTSNQNWATLGTGIVKNTTTTGALSDAASADVYGLFTSCTGSSGLFLKDGGTCAAPGGSGTVTSIATTAPLGGGTITTTGTLTCTTCATTTNGGALSAVSPLNLTAGGAISLQNATPANVTSAIGTDTAVPTAGTIAAAAPVACTDANSGVTTSGCMGSEILVSSTTSSLTPSGTQYMGMGFSTSALNGSQAPLSIRMPRAGTFTGMSVRLSAAEGAAATLQFTLQNITQSLSAITCTVGNSATTCDDSSHTVAFALHDTMVIQTIQTGTGTSQFPIVTLTYQ